MAALAVVAPATAVGREIPSDPSGDRPQARAAALFVPVVAGLVVRAAAPVASRLGASIVGGIVGKAAPQIGRARTARSLMDARTVAIRKRIFGFVRTRRWLRKKWPNMKPYSLACLGGAAYENKSILINAFAYLDWEPFDTNLRRTAAGCGFGMGTLWAGKYYFSRALR